MGTPVSIRSHQIFVVTVATLLAALFLHWFINPPVSATPARNELNFWATLLFWTNRPSLVLTLFQKLTLGIIATTGLAACTLAVVLALRVPGQGSARHLARALVCGSFASAYVFLVTPHAQYGALLGWTATSAIRLILDFAGYTAGLLAALFLSRFFIGYPRVLTPEDWEAEALRWRQRTRTYPPSAQPPRPWFHFVALRALMTNRAGEKRWFKLTSDAEQAREETRLLLSVQSGRAMGVVVAWALVCAVLDWLNARQPAGADGPASLIGLASTLASGASIGALFWAFSVANASLRMFSNSVTPDDRRKIDWIKATVLVGGVFVCSFALIGTVLAPFLLNWLAAREIFPPAEVLILGPFTLAAQLFVLAFIIALALSIFYRGAVDPRLAARKITVYGVLSMLLAIVFVVIERLVALEFVEFFGLSPNTGAVIAFGGVAVTAAPIKRHAEKAITGLASRFLPLESMIEGERRTMVVALSDLSGYTLLSSTDEKQAVLLAALLQRQAARLTKMHGGRVVKSMGDAVLFAFDDAASAASVMKALHAGFAPAADQLGLTVLSVHSGAHVGEVTISRDGDLYGQTVNVAARIQGSAVPGQIVVSEAFAEAHASAAYRDLGPRQFKNVPGIVACRELAV